MDVKKNHAMKKWIPFLSALIGIPAALCIIHYVRDFPTKPVIPKPGEVWRVTKPFIGDVTIDSINRFGNICFHDNDSAQGRGICAPEYFVGKRMIEVKIVRDTTIGGIKKNGHGGLDTSYHKKGSFWRSADIEIDTVEATTVQSRIVGSNTLIEDFARNYGYYSKKQLDSAYRAGIIKGKRSCPTIIWRSQDWIDPGTPADTSLMPMYYRILKKSYGIDSIQTYSVDGSGIWHTSKDSIISDTLKPL